MTDPAESQEIVIVTGMSGAGRSTAANALEDLGWYVVDNLPPMMLTPLLEMASRAATNLPRIAAVVDVRGGALFTDAESVIGELRRTSSARVLFLDATDAALVRRFESVRRPHPLQGDGTLLDGIGAERDRLRALRESSDIIIDTSELNVHQLNTAVRDVFRSADQAELHINVMSFGFKYGLPADADNVADARFLPNPYWIPELRNFNGLDAPVSEYVLSRPGAERFLDAYYEALLPILEGYQRENKRHATIAIGCTGGKHRSVALTQQLAARLSALETTAVNVRHRDLGRE